MCLRQVHVQSSHHPTTDGELVLTSLQHGNVNKPFWHEAITIPIPGAKCIFTVSYEGAEWGCSYRHGANMQGRQVLKAVICCFAFLLLRRPRLRALKIEDAQSRSCDATSTRNKTSDERRAISDALCSCLFLCSRQLRAKSICVDTILPPPKKGMPFPSAHCA